MQLVSQLPMFHELLVCDYIHNSLPVDPTLSHILHSMLYISLSCSCITICTQEKQCKMYPTYRKHSETAHKASLRNIIVTRLLQCQGYRVVKLTTGHKSRCGHPTEYSLHSAAWKNHRILLKAHSKTERTKSTKVF